MVLMVSVLFMVGAMAFVWSNVRMVKQAYEYQELMQERRNLMRKNHLLKIEVESLRSLDRIQQLARKRIGLRNPDNRQIATVFLK